MKKLQKLAIVLVAALSSSLSFAEGSVVNDTYQKLKLQFYSAQKPTKALPADPAWPSYFVDGKKNAGQQATVIPSEAAVLQLRYSHHGKGYSSSSKSSALYSWQVSPNMSYVITGNIMKDPVVPYTLTDSLGNVIAPMTSPSV